LYDKLSALNFLADTKGMLEKDRNEREAPFKVLVIGSSKPAPEAHQGDGKDDNPGP